MNTRPQIEEGHRVRLHSGAAVGTVESISKSGLCIVRWPSGHTEAWPPSSLVVLSDD